MFVETMALPGVPLIDRGRFGDHGAVFEETRRLKISAEQGVVCDFVQNPDSVSKHQSALGARRFQAQPADQAGQSKRGRGVVSDVAIDSSRGSTKVEHWTGYELSAEGGRQAVIPVGIAHGPCTLNCHTEIVYRYSGHDLPEIEGAWRWDYFVAIDWPLRGDAVLRPKAQSALVRPSAKPVFSNDGA